MVSLISRIPTWLSVVLGGVGVAGLAILPSLLPSWDGAGAVIATIVLGLCAVCGVAAPAVQHWESERAKRLDLVVNISDRSVPTWEDVPAAVQAVGVAEEQAVLKPLHEEQALQRAKKAQEDATSTTSAAKAGAIGGVTIKEIKRLLEKERRGEDLSATEAAHVARHRESMASIYKTAASIAAGISAFSETRSPAAFEAEARKHAAKAADQAQQAVRIAFLSDPSYALQVDVTNPTPRTLEEVEVEVYIPGAIAAEEGEEPLDERDLSLPTRPWPYGKPQPQRLRLNTGLLHPGISLPSVMDPGAPSIDNSASARITFASIDIRPESTVSLRPIWLITSLPTGTRLAATWEATARNAEGKLTGQFEVRVGDPLKAEPVLRRLVSYDPA